MIELAAQVKLRGGTPLDPLRLQRRYLDRLSVVIEHRLADLRTGACSPEQYPSSPARATCSKPCGSAACASISPAAPTKST